MIKDPFARLGLDREVLTVTQLNGRARVLLEDVTVADTRGVYLL